MTRSLLPKTKEALTQAAAPNTITVAQVVRRIRDLIEGQFPTPIWIEGEVSNCTYASSGHIYLSLVDEKVTDRFGQRLVLPCAFFKNANASMKFRLEDGMKVLCLGHVTTYESRGSYQLRVLKVEPKGVGALQVAFDQLKKRLSEEGLFDDARKQAIPKLPDRVGIITSDSGSVIHDMVSKLKGKFHLIILPVKVQGEGAAREIAGAIKTANKRRLADVLIVGRGGGSVEDLWAFNEEPVARAIFESKIPVISAIGHQDDWTIADYVADLRASTPTDAAKMLVHEQQLLVDEARMLIERLVDSMRLFLDDQRRHVEQLSHRLRLLHPKHQLQEYTQRALESLKHLVHSMRHSLQQEDRTLAGLVGRLDALSPLAVLARGYSVTRRQSDGKVVTRAAGLKAGDVIETLLAEGQVESTVTKTQRTRED